MTTCSDLGKPGDVMKISPGVRRPQSHEPGAGEVVGMKCRTSTCQRAPSPSARGWVSSQRSAAGPFLLAAHAPWPALRNSLKRHPNSAPRQPDGTPDFVVIPPLVGEVHDQAITICRVHLRRPSRPQKAGLKLRGSGDLIRATSTHALKRRSPSPVTAGTTSGERLALPLHRTR